MASNAEQSETAAIMPHGAEAPAPKTQLVASRETAGGLIPRTFDDLYRLSKIMAASGMMPQGMQKVEQVFVAVQLGLEVGLSPMQAVQNIAVVNGRPSLWGDAAMGLVRASGLCESCVEIPLTDSKGAVTGYRCIARRKGESEPIAREFTVDDAKRAGLLGKKGPWTEYPQRMLQMRARSWALRDGFADVLKGLSVREEAQDIPETIEPSGPVTVEEKTATLRDRLAAMKVTSADEAKPVESSEVETAPGGETLTLS